VAEIVSIATPGLGNNAYLVGSGDRAVVVDPPRDGWRVAEVAAEHGWRVSHVLETHVHNDYLSGARELQRSQGSRIVAPARGRYRFEHQAAGDGFSLDLGDGGLVARATPGHTPEHLSWEVRDGDGTPRALFSGGSLLIGGVGRTDLLGRTRTPELTRAQFESMQLLAQLPGDVAVYPTHGAGSFCVAGDTDGPSSATIAALRRWNPAFAAPDLASFERELAAGRTLYPSYYRRMAPLNRRGPRILGASVSPRPLVVQDVVAARQSGVWLVDVRDRWAFAARHISGSWNVELGDALSAYLGWILPFDAPICLIVDDPIQEVEAVDEMTRIGFDHVIGHLHGGLDAWVASGGETRSYETASWQELQAYASGESGDAAHVLDVRQPYEWRDGAIPGSRRIFVADLPGAVGSLDKEKPWLVACRTGVRATIAASLLDAAGIPARPVVDGGIPALPPGELVAVG
jgi:glyoxylase-like metal-dependent hydrolase (beta-lactamase superfamily II)/rhodanese-related sulfurtransferase